MLNEAKILERYHENYELAFEESHLDPSEIAWQWTEEEILRQFYLIQERHKWHHIENVNKVFYG
jgi:hypothetical protein